MTSAPLDNLIGFWERVRARPRAGLARLGAWLAPRAITVPFRLGVALLVLALQFLVAVRSGDRFGVPFNRAPGHPPGFRDPSRERVPTNWDRLVVARWDSGQYIELGLRGYQYCPPRGPALPVFSPTCNLEFYPTYGLVGRWLGRLSGLPIDFALLAVSLVSSFLFLFLWTGPALTERLGVGETYLALLLFNTFTTGYCLVTIQTEPLTLVLAMGAFVAFAQRRHLLGALLAGATSGVRITGVAIGIAYAVGLLIEQLQRSRPGWRAWARLGGLAVLSAWGELALMAVHGIRFGDPLAYVHAHALAFKHHPTIASTLWPDPEWLVKGIDYPLHEALWWAAALFWYLLGRRDALTRFPPAQRTFWALTFWATLGIATVGMMPIGLAGMSRYLLLALPLFFAMAVVMKPRPALLAFWLAVSVWHYWNIDICSYTGGMGWHVLNVCHEGHRMERPW
ncbi:MAG TPA: hypothetical protein VN962_16235 [Polyangia bacterium]|nr:hypothetical protein [Polyangia bacterium]